MSMPEGEGRNYGGKKFPQNIPYVHPGTPDSNCNCDLCKQARQQEKAAVPAAEPATLDPKDLTQGLI